MTRQKERTKSFVRMIRHSASRIGTRRRRELESALEREIGRVRGRERVRGYLNDDLAFVVAAHFFGVMYEKTFGEAKANSFTVVRLDASQCVSRSSTISL